MKNNEREPGLYWVKINDGTYKVYLFTPDDKWHAIFCVLQDDADMDGFEIDENRIRR